MYLNNTTAQVMEAMARLKEENMRFDKVRQKGESQTRLVLNQQDTGC